MLISVLEWLITSIGDRDETCQEKEKDFTAQVGENNPSEDARDEKRIEATGGLAEDGPGDELEDERKWNEVRSAYEGNRATVAALLMLLVT